MYPTSIVWSSRILWCICALGCGASAPSQAAEPAQVGPTITVTAELGEPHVGSAAPDFEVSTPEGQTLQLSALRGKVVMLAFVTSWCPFSQAEQPYLAQLASDYAENADVEVVIVDIDQQEEGYRKYLAKTPMNAPVYWTASAEAVSAYVPPKAVPTITRGRWRVLVTANLVIDKKGVIRFFTITDTLHFDAKLNFVRSAISEIEKEPA